MRHLVRCLDSNFRWAVDVWSYFIADDNHALRYERSLDLAWVVLARFARLVLARLVLTRLAARAAAAAPRPRPWGTLAASASAAAAAAAGAPAATTVRPSRSRHVLRDAPATATAAVRAPALSSLGLLGPGRLRSAMNFFGRTATSSVLRRSLVAPRPPGRCGVPAPPSARQRWPCRRPPR